MTIDTAAAAKSFRPTRKSNMTSLPELDRAKKEYADEASTWIHDAGERRQSGSLNETSTIA
jgi:hypothetical protein